MLIGTSPLVLCHALDRSLRGESIRILEERRETGGAWRTVDAFGCGGVEAAVHLIENRSAVHRALSQLGVPLNPPAGRTGALLGGVEIPLALSRALAYLGVSGKSVLRGDLGRAHTALIGLGRAVREYRTPFLYPPRGARQITDRLLQLLAARGVQPECGIRVRQARRLGCGACLVETDHGEFAARRIAIASRAHCRLRREDRTLDLSLRTTSLECIALLLEGPAPSFDYIEFHGRTTLRRARNLTAMTHPSPAPDRHIVSVEIRAPAAQASRPGACEHAHAAEALATLQRAGLVAPSTMLIAARIERFEVRTIPDWRMRRIAREECDWILPMRTTDFGEELASALGRLQLASHPPTQSTRHAAEMPPPEEDREGARKDFSADSPDSLGGAAHEASSSRVAS